MVRKMTLILTGMLLSTSLLMATLALAGPYTYREERQQDRIAQGVASGQLTPGETARLEREEARIEAERRAFWADGNLSPAERAKLTHDLNKTSRDVYRLKHNGRHQ